MKKLTVFLLTIIAAVIVVISFTSCDKEEPAVPEVSGAGVYNPGKKISKIYRKLLGGTELIAEKWTWERGKIAAIEYYSGGYFDHRDDFKYKDGRISQIKTSQGYYTEFFYTGDQYEIIKCYDPDAVLIADFTFQYSGKKVSVISYNNYALDKNGISMIERGFLAQLLPEEGIQIIAEKLADSPKATTEICYSYEGDNVSSISMGSYVYTYSDYDTYSNIKFNYHPFSFSMNGIFFNNLVFSKNNQGKITYEDGMITHFTYTYDGDFPLTIQAKTLYDGGDSTVVTTRMEYQ